MVGAIQGASSLQHLPRLALFSSTDADVNAGRGGADARRRSEAGEVQGKQKPIAPGSLHLSSAAQSSPESHV